MTTENKMDRDFVEANQTQCVIFRFGPNNIDPNYTYEHFTSEPVKTGYILDDFRPSFEPTASRNHGGVA